MPTIVHRSRSSPEISYRLREQNGSGVVRGRRAHVIVPARLSRTAGCPHCPSDTLAQVQHLVVISLTPTGCMPFAEQRLPISLDTELSLQFGVSVTPMCVWLPDQPTSTSVIRGKTRTSCPAGTTGFVRVVNIGVAFSRRRQ